VAVEGWSRRVGIETHRNAAWAEVVAARFRATRATTVVTAFVVSEFREGTGYGIL
jgi:hypothetical protein